MQEPHRKWTKWVNRQFTSLWTSTSHCLEEGPPRSRASVFSIKKPAHEQYSMLSLPVETEVRLGISFKHSTSQLPLRNKQALAGVAKLVAMSSYKPKGWGINSRSQHMPRLWVRPPSEYMQETTNWSFSLTSVFLSLSLSLSLPLSLKIKGHVFGWGLKKKKQQPALIGVISESIKSVWQKDSEPIWEEFWTLSRFPGRSCWKWGYVPSLYVPEFDATVVSYFLIH